MLILLLNLILLPAVFFLFYCPAAYAWYGSGDPVLLDVHYRSTYNWARESNFNDEDAKIIAKADKNADHSLLFFNKTWHLGDHFEIETTYKTASREDCRIKHADDEMRLAVEIMRSIPGDYSAGSEKLRKSALQHLGKGLHPLQDYYAHMNAGVNHRFEVFIAPFFHGELFVGVPLYDESFQIITPNAKLERMFDDIHMDYIATEQNINGKKIPFKGWIKRTSPSNNTRLEATKMATEEYFREFCKQTENG